MYSSDSLDCSVAGPGQPDETLKVCDMTDASGKWDWTRLNLLLPNHVQLQIATILPPCSHEGADRIAWKWSTSDTFLSAETHKNLAGFGNFHPSMNLDLVWKCKAPQRVRVFL